MHFLVETARFVEVVFAVGGCHVAGLKVGEKPYSSLAFPLWNRLFRRSRELVDVARRRRLEVRHLAPQGVGLQLVYLRGGPRPARTSALEGGGGRAPASPSSRPSSLISSAEFFALPFASTLLVYTQRPPASPTR